MILPVLHNSPWNLENYCQALCKYCVHFEKKSWRHTAENCIDKNNETLNK